MHDRELTKIWYENCSVPTMESTSNSKSNVIIMSDNETNLWSHDFECFSESLEAHPSSSCILIEMRAKGDTLEKVMEILNKIDVQVVEYTFVKKGDPAWIILRLSVADMRIPALKLTEAGFTRLKGINPVTKR